MLIFTGQISRVLHREQRSPTLDFELRYVILSGDIKLVDLKYVEMFVGIRICLS